MSEKSIRHLRQTLGVIALIVLIIGVYYSYKVLAYILNWEQGNQQTYTNYMTILVYLLFILTSLFVVAETLLKSGAWSSKM